MGREIAHRVAEHEARSYEHIRRPGEAHSRVQTAAPECAPHPGTLLSDQERHRGAT
jgi:hypothetical protein